LRVSGKLFHYCRARAKYRVGRAASSYGSSARTHPVRVVGSSFTGGESWNEKRCVTESFACVPMRPRCAGKTEAEATIFAAERLIPGKLPRCRIHAQHEHAVLVADFLAQN